MAQLLELCARKADPRSTPFLNVERVDLARRHLATRATRTTESALRLELATELLHAGDPEAALAEIDRAEAAARAAAPGGVLASPQTFDRLRAVCWMRVGEVENCLERHCCSSCIAPIDEGGAHVEKRGSRAAIGVLERMLARDQGDAEARWLLNLAHMTLGSWPAAVPAQFRIGRERFASEHDLPRFRDVASECGLAIASLSGGACVEDFDGDGFLDVLVSSMGLRDPLRIFRGGGDGTFTERTEQAGLTGLTGGLNLVHADYDNDGWADVLVLRGGWFDKAGEIPNSLLRNRGDGTFEDVTEAAGLLSFHPTQTAAFADFDGDGWLDIVVGNETSRADRLHPCELFLNRRDGTFRDVAARVGAAAVGFVKAVAVGDIDDDGRPDLFLSRRGQSNLLLRNLSDPRPGSPGFRFVDVTEAAGVEGPVMSFPSWFFDYDNDGRLDLFVATYTNFMSNAPEVVGAFVGGTDLRIERTHLYRNEGGGRFRDVAPEVGLDRAILTMGSNYGDLDNDGWLDVYLGNGAPSFAALLPNKAFRNDGGRRFQDVTTSAGLGHLQKGHGVAFADFDHDGDQDLFLEVGGFYSSDVYPDVLFENPGGGNRWITLRLEGVKANRSAIGARIRVDVAAPTGERSIHVVCGTGGSFGSSSLQQEIGLGDATEVKRVEIRWPGSDSRQTVTGIGLDRVWRIVEGRVAPEEVAVRRIELGGSR